MPPAGSRTSPGSFIPCGTRCSATPSSGPSRTLTVTNPYARQLGYRVIAKKRGSRKETELPVSSVRSGQQTTMSTSEPFDELVLYQFHLQG